MIQRRLLVISNNYDLAGAPIALFNVLVALRDRYEFLVTSQRDGPLRQQLLDAGIDALVVPDLLQKTEVSAELIQSHDALIANTLPSFQTIHAAAQAKKPSLWIIHEGLAWQRFLQDCAPAAPEALELATRLAVPCQWAGQLYRAWRATPIDVIPWGVSEFPLPDPRPTDGPIKLLVLGTIQHRKGQDIALAAMKTLDQGSYCLELVGKVENDGFYRQLVGQCGTTGSVHFYGPVSMDHVSHTISGCDVLLVPSRDELTPLVILEAMALGKPVIAADVGGVGEMIDDGRTGFLFQPEEPSQLAVLIARLGRDASLRRRMGAAARQFVRSQRTHQQCADRYAHILDELWESVPAGHSLMPAAALS